MRIMSRKWSPVPEADLDELLGPKIGNIESWFCSEYIKQIAINLAMEVCSHRNLKGESPHGDEL